MAENYPMCVRRRVALRTDADRSREVDAVCHGDLCVAHPVEHPDFAVFHVPSGSSLAAAGLCFRYEHVAVAAMMDVAGVFPTKANRLVFDSSEELRAARPALVEIGRRHGGHVLDRGSRPLAFRQDLNGYGDE